MKKILFEGFFLNLKKIAFGKDKKKIFYRNLKIINRKRKKFFQGFESRITFEIFEKNYKLLQVGDNSKINLKKKKHINKNEFYLIAFIFLTHILIF